MGRTLLALGLSVWVYAVWAQAPEKDDQQVSFEVASVKPSSGQTGFGRWDGGPGSRDPGRFTAAGARLSDLLEEAYDVWPDQVSGPGWLETEPYDVVAKLPPGATRAQFRMMLRNLLAERFRIEVHHETRVVPVYELVVAKNGPKLKPAEEGAGKDRFIPGSGPRPEDRDGFPILPPGRPNMAGHFDASGAHQTFRMMTMQFLAGVLSGPGRTGRRVIDKTGLTGKYDFTLYYRPAGGPPAPAGTDDDAPSIEQAVQEQLGLKLVPSKQPLDVVVIDHAERVPTEN